MLRTKRRSVFQHQLLTPNSHVTRSLLTHASVSPSVIWLRRGKVVIPTSQGLLWELKCYCEWRTVMLSVVSASSWNVTEEIWTQLMHKALDLFLWVNKIVFDGKEIEGFLPLLPFAPLYSPLWCVLGFFVCFCFYFLAKLQFSYLNITHGLWGIHLTSRMGDKISEVNCVHQMFAYFPVHLDYLAQSM